MVTCHQVANYFLALTDEDAGDAMSNLRLQKLVYYAQGFHLALRGQPLFAEPIEAWTQGPVVPELYERFKSYAAGAIPVAEAGDAATDLPGKVKELLDEVYAVFGQFSAWKLRELTHAEPPWANTPCGTEISHQALREHFATMLTDDAKAQTS